MKKRKQIKGQSYNDFCRPASQMCFDRIGSIFFIQLLDEIQYSLNGELYWQIRNNVKNFLIEQRIGLNKNGR